MRITVRVRRQRLDEQLAPAVACLERAHERRCARLGPAEVARRRRINRWVLLAFALALLAIVWVAL